MSRGHLFHTVRKKPEEDQGLANFITNGENCRRLSLLQSLGDSSTAVASNHFECCDCCSPSALSSSSYSRLNILKKGVVSRIKRRRAIRSVDKDLLKDKLVSARNSLLQQQDDFCVVGVNFFCSDSIIDKLCEQAKFIETVDDFSVELFGIRQEIKHTFFSIICNTCSLISDSRSQRRRLM